LLAGFYIVNEYSGKVLDDPGAWASDGAVIQQFQLNGGSNQRWDFVGLSNGNYAIYNESSGKVLGDPGCSKSSGTGIMRWQWNGGLNEQWQLVVVAPNPNPGY
jgi:Ricin-type beta-trefoil lectin domain-like